MIGETFGRYQIVEAIGAGGMGIVYRAHDVTLDRDVALKLLHAEALESPAARDRFLREARALSHLNHPHICTVHEIGEVRGRAFIAMEYVKGRQLSAVIPSDGLPLETLSRYGIQIADAIGHAHEHGIVHRDLKSSNVVVTPEGGVKVLDFGIARREDRDEDGRLQTQERITQPGVVMGTPGYMAPEVIVGKPADARADIWALGVILHEMASGALPFTGPTPIEFASAILKESPAPLPPRVPPMLRGIVQRCLAKEPGQRYHNAGEVRAALEAVASAPLTETLSPQRRVGGRHLRWAMVGIAVAVLLAAIALNTTGWRNNPTETPIRSVAVLPLENLSGDPEQEYFADGMTDQLTADLSSISTLRVISRTSVMQYKKARKPLPAIAKELNVDAVVEGSVVRVGDKVRITARLIRAGTEETLWAQSYERDLRDVLALQSEVAKSVAGEVDITLTPQEQTRLARARPVNPEAHELSLLGSFHASKGTEEGLRKGIQYYEQAIAKDPGDAGSYTGMAEAYTELSSWYEHPRVAMPRAKAAAETAVKLNDSLAAAHAVLWIRPPPLRLGCACRRPGAATRHPAQSEPRRRQVQLRGVPAYAKSARRGRRGDPSRCESRPTVCPDAFARRLSPDGGATVRRRHCACSKRHRVETGFRPERCFTGRRVRSARSFQRGPRHRAAGCGTRRQPVHRWAGRPCPRRRRSEGRG